ncbi:MAG TPA: hypothetical protein VFA64_13995 [Hyphomicrobiaceae bacterium]|nr:hypothetical protein [Hyphomicrobiaceae bacterium]
MESRHRLSEPAAGRGAAAGGVPWGMAALAVGAVFCIVLGALSLDDGALPPLAPASEADAPQDAGCTSLVIDRRTGHTTAEPCRGILRDAVASARADLTPP